jgi:3-oxoacyl-[acyl-carrier-protein] synthase-3
MAVILRSVACYYPDKILTNDDLSEMVDTSDEWITERTGIKERRIAGDDMECSDMAAIAGQRAIDKAGLTNADIDCLILATCAPDQPNPATACITAGKMGLNGIPAFDMNAMCSGFLYALHVASGLVESKSYRNVLVIGSEKLSDIIDWTDRRTCILFGDAAGAAIVSSGDASE